LENHEFVKPKKEIGPGPDDIPKWEKSEVDYALIPSYIVSLATP